LSLASATPGAEKTRQATAPSNNTCFMLTLFGSDDRSTNDGASRLGPSDRFYFRFVLEMFNSAC
jgi:hypothetical protein